MVLRNKKRSRKFLGSRSWGVGNIKNARGSGSRGGTGRGSRKSKFTRTVKYEKWRIKKVGFTPWRKSKLVAISLDAVSRRVEQSGTEKPTLELDGYKVLSNGALTRPAVIKATGFSKKAMDKIKASGGEAVRL